MLPSTLGAMSVRVSWEQVLAWRMRRHFLDPIGSPSVPEVVSRLCGVQAQVASSAELAVRVRRGQSSKGEVARALRDGRLIKTWAMRGTLHLLEPAEAGSFLSLIASGRSWERPSWQRYLQVTSKQLDGLWDVLRDALARGPQTREDLAAAVARKRSLAHVADELRSGWGMLLKPLAWKGELCVDPNGDSGRVRFVRPSDVSPRWSYVSDPEEAAPAALSAYFRAYGPTTVDAFGKWLAGGHFGKRRLRVWFDAIGDRFAEVDIEGERAYVLTEDLDELVSTRPTSAVRLLPGFDQYVLGPGTGDGRVVPTARRPLVSKQSGWIAPVVVVGGVVCGTWAVNGDEARIAWFAEAGPHPRRALEAEVVRLSAIVGRDLQRALSVVS
jgi:Winged helix DNA-binding domain